jgi:hypothetical protein
MSCVELKICSWELSENVRHEEGEPEFICFSKVADLKS